MGNKQYLDETERCYFVSFGEAKWIAHGVMEKPPVDVYAFNCSKVGEFVYLSKGMEDGGYRELAIICRDEAKWPVDMIQAVAAYQIGLGENLGELETISFEEATKEAGSFRSVIILGMRLLDFDEEKLARDLGLKNSPLLVFPITEKELDYALSNGQAELVKAMAGSLEPYASINRVSIIDQR